jgi:hypothetical protein
MRLTSASDLEAFGNLRRHGFDDLRKVIQQPLPVLCPVDSLRPFSMPASSYRCFTRSLRALPLFVQIVVDVTGQMFAVQRFRKSGEPDSRFRLSCSPLKPSGICRSHQLRAPRKRSSLTSSFSASLGYDSLSAVESSLLP